MGKKASPGADPIREFLRFFDAAKRKAGGDDDVTAVTLATADESGRPSARMVLLKGVDEHGFVFYTNYESRKARELDANPWAALCFHWAWTGKQVRVEGQVARLPAAESDEYFARRPRGSRIGAWASKQSRPLSSRARLLARVAEMEARFAGRRIPRPDDWGGYRLAPERIEVWHNQLYRLHDRFVYERDGEGWVKSRLYP